LNSYPSTLLFQSILDGIKDGILVLNEHQEIIYANPNAQQICRQLYQDSEEQTNIPKSLWKICQLLTESYSVFPRQPVLVAEQLITNQSIMIAVRVQWLNISRFSHPHLLIRLETPSYSVQSVAITEAQFYRLTPSETKVWLLSRANYTYKQIATELDVTINTIKKHMKSIYAKQRRCSAA
jgi:DNA-binding CsgD family transcriptional regulator